MTRLSVPPSWHDLLARLERGTILVAGATGTGKSHLARYLVSQLDRPLDRVGLVDADVGQSSIGVPTCLGMALTAPWQAPAALWFVGDVSPRGHLLPIVVGTAELVRRAYEQGAQAVVVDTPGLVTGPVGQLLQAHLAIATRADRIVTIERGDELVALVSALATDSRPVHRLAPAAAARDRTLEQRRAYRDSRFEAHFRGAGRRWFGPGKLLGRDFGPVPIGSVRPGTILGLLDDDGACLGLGLVREVGADRLAVLTPVAEPRPVARLQVGVVTIDPAGWAEPPE